MDPRQEYGSRITEYLTSLCCGIMSAEAVSELLGGVDVLPGVVPGPGGGVVWPSYMSIRIMRSLLLSSPPAADFAASAELTEIRKRRVRLYFRLLHQVRSAVMRELEADADFRAHAGDWVEYVKHRFVWRARARRYLMVLYCYGIQFRFGRAIDIRSVAADLTELLAALDKPDQPRV
jgi:hypothetical protein